MIKLAIFDFDSTLMDGETITIFAKEVGKSDDVAKITHRAMSGELDFYHSLKERVTLLKGVDIQKIELIARNLPFIKGAKEIISYLKEKNIKVVVFSGGFHIATDHAKQILGFDASFANYLDVKDGKLSGEVYGEMMFDRAKGAVLKELKELFGLKKEEVLAVGDGANDISMFKEAGVSIAFCAKEVLKAHATHCVDIKDLREIKKYV